MTDSYTPLDRDAVVAILADYIRLGTNEAVEAPIAEAADRIVELAARAQRDARRAEKTPLDIEMAPRLGWWGEAIGEDSLPTPGLARARVEAWRGGGRVTFPSKKSRGKIAAVRFYRDETGGDDAPLRICVLDHPIATPGADRVIVDISIVREAES